MVKKLLKLRRSLELFDQGRKSPQNLQYGHNVVFELFFWCLSPDHLIVWELLKHAPTFGNDAMIQFIIGKGIFLNSLDNLFRDTIESIIQLQHKLSIRILC